MPNVPLIAVKAPNWSALSVTSVPFSANVSRLISVASVRSTAPEAPSV